MPIVVVIVIVVVVLRNFFLYIETKYFHNLSNDFEINDDIMCGVCVCCLVFFCFYCLLYYICSCSCCWGSRNRISFKFGQFLFRVFLFSNVNVQGINREGQNSRVIITAIDVNIYVYLLIRLRNIINNVKEKECNRERDIYICI